MFDNSGNDYTSVEYWDSRFKEEESYEWIADFKQFSRLIVEELKESDRFLQLIQRMSQENSRRTKDPHLICMTNFSSNLNFQKNPWHSLFCQLSEFFLETPYIFGMLLHYDFSILHIGCGNSQLSFQLYSAGFEDITNLDYSNVLIEKLSEKNPEMKWICDDMRSLEKLETESFDVVIEKAAIESLLANEKSVWTFSDSGQKDLRLTLASIYRILKPGGTFISISFTPPYFRVNYLIEQNWNIEVKEFGEGFHFYFYKMTKGNEPNLKDLENYLRVNRN